MESKYLIIGICLIIFILILILILPKNSGPVIPKFQIYSTSLDGKQEVPSNSSTATGKGQATLSFDNTYLTYDIIVSGLVPTNAYFQRSRKGENGPIVKTLTFIPIIINNISSYRITGTWTNSDQEPFTRSLSEDLKAGLIYINVLSSAFPEGEIRGQLIKS